VLAQLAYPAVGALLMSIFKLAQLAKKPVAAHRASNSNLTAHSLLTTVMALRALEWTRETPGQAEQPRLAGVDLLRLSNLVRKDPCCKTQVISAG